MATGNLQTSLGAFTYRRNGGAAPDAAHGGLTVGSCPSVFCNLLKTVRVPANRDGDMASII